MIPVAASLLALTLLATHAGEPSTALNPAEPSIGGIILGQTESEVLETLGRPLSRNVEEGYYDLSLEYDRVAIHFAGGTVDAILSSNPAFCLNAGVCPGQRYAEAVTVLGKPHERNTLVSGTSVARFLTGIDCWIVVVERNNRISSVEVKCPT